MDDFLEQTAVRKRQGIYTLLYYACWLVIAVFGIAALISLTGVVGTDPETGRMAFSLRALIVMLVAGGIAFAMYRGKDYCRLEYDYTFTNGSLDISGVMNQRRRRYLCSVETKDVIRCGPATGPAFAKTLSEPGIKRHNWFVNREAKLYFFYFAKKGVKHVIVLELSDEMISTIRSKNYLQRTAWYEADGSQHYGMGIS